jgi:hypothetical protein
MELKQCGPEEARKTMREHVERNVSTKEFYRALQDWSGNRILVDKSPHYALDPAALQKAERDFQGPFYIHLARHPYAVVRSFQAQHMEQILYLKDHDYSPRELGELVWTLSHQNIEEFLGQIPQSRQFRIQFEELTHEPRQVMDSLCDALSLEFHPDLLQPYKDQHKKMVDGVYAASTPMGDINFLGHQSIDPQIADRWKGVESDNFLGDVTWQVARSLGYEPPGVDREGDNAWSQSRAIARQRRIQQQQRRARRQRARNETGT